MKVYTIKEDKPKDGLYFSSLEICSKLQMFLFRSEYKTMGFRNVLNHYGKKDIEFYINKFLASKWSKKKGCYKVSAYNVQGVEALLNDIRKEEGEEVTLVKGYKEESEYTPVYNENIFNKCKNKLTIHKKFEVDDYNYCICSYSASDGKQYKFIMRRKI